jgi:hypothetical protein
VRQRQRQMPGTRTNWRQRRYSVPTLIWMPGQQQLSRCRASVLATFLEACLLLLQAAIGAAIGALSSGRPMSEAQQAAEAAAAAADAASVQNMPEALDEFGRDTNVEKRRQVHLRITSSFIVFTGHQCRFDWSAATGGQRASSALEMVATLTLYVAG